MARKHHVQAQIARRHRGYSILPSRYTIVAVMCTYCNNDDGISHLFERLFWEPFRQV